MAFWLEPTEEELAAARIELLRGRRPSSFANPAQAMAGVSGAPEGQMTEATGGAAPQLGPGDKRYLDSLLGNEEFMSSMDSQDAQRKALDRQMMQAEALMGSNMASKRTSALGAALSGIGDVMKAYRGGKLSREADAKLAGLDATAAKGERNRVLLSRATRAEDMRVQAEREAARQAAEDARIEADRKFRADSEQRGYDFKNAQFDKEARLQRELAGMRVKEGATEKAQQRADERTDKQAQDLAAKLEGLPSIRQDIATLQKYATMEDVPGIGKFDGRAPSMFISEDGKKVRQATRGIIGTLLKKRSGTAASEKEIQRVMEELGISDTATDEEFKIGMQRFLPQVEAEYRTTESGFPPEAVQRVRERGGVTSADLPKAAAQSHSSAGPEVMIANGKRYRRQSDGTYLPE